MEQDDLSWFIRKRMTELGLKQGEVAERAHMSRQGLVKLLSGDVRDPQISTVRGLAFALNVSPIYLFRLLLGRNIIDKKIQASAFTVGDHSSFVGDVTIPDGTMVPPGFRFEKIWDIQNSGTTDWIGRYLHCMNAPDPVEQDETSVVLRPDAERILIPDTRPGDVVRLSVWFTAPDMPGSSISTWKMVDADGALLFPLLNGLNCIVTVTAA